MNCNSLMEALQTLSATLGYTPTTLAQLHTTLHQSGLPIALLHAPKIVAIEGERERRVEYKFVVNLLIDSKPEERLCPAVMDRLATDGESLLRSLAERNNVLSVAKMGMEIHSRPLTVAGDAAIMISANVVMLECC